MLARLFASLLLIFAAHLACAHPAPFSYLDVHLDDSGFRGSLVIHDFDAAHELGIDNPEALRDPALVARHRERLTALIASRLRLAADTRPLELRWGDLEVLAERQSLLLPFSIEAPVPGRLEIDTVLFPYDPNHQTFINIYERDRLEHQAILDARHRGSTYYSGTAQGRWAAFRTFVQAGVHHIFIGPDHILFLFALLLLGGSIWRLAGIVTAFTIGHSVTLSLAALGVLRIAPSVVEPAIALSIVVVGVDNLLMQRGAVGDGSAAGSRDLRPWLAATFGLIHGFGFAAVLAELGLPREALGWSLAAFNVGVETGQLAIVVPVAALLALLRRRSTVLAKRLVLFGSVAVIAAGVYWFVERI